MRRFLLSILVGFLASSAGPSQAVPVHFSIDVDIGTSSTAFFPAGFYPNAGSFTVDSGDIPSEGHVLVYLTDLVLTVADLQATSADFEEGVAAEFLDGMVLGLTGASNPAMPSTMGVFFFDQETVILLAPDEESSVSATYSVQAVAEPSLLALAGLAAIGFAAWRHRSR